MAKRDRPTRLASLGATLLAALVLAACGSGGGDEGRSDPSAARAMKTAGERTRAAHNARFELTLDAGPQVDLTMKGATSTDEDAMSGTIDFGATPGAPPPGTRFVARDETFWFKYKGEDRWVKPATDPNDPSASTDLATSLRSLGATTQDARVDGHETVRGQRSTRYSATLDLKKFRDTLPPEEREDYNRGLERFHLSRLPTTVWVGDDGLIRRFRFEIDLSKVPRAGSAKLVAVFELFDHGHARPATPPAPEDTIEQ